MISRISCFITRLVSRWLPGPLIFAMLLALLTFVVALRLTSQTPISIVKMWGDGFWNSLAFGMQMALIIVTGHALANSASAKSLLRTTVSAAKMLVQDVMPVIFPGSIACVISWGLGLVVGAILAHKVTRRVPGPNYPLLIAYAYIDFLTWGGGFSGSMPLLAVTPDNPVEHITGLIPVGDTLSSGFNIFIIVALIVVMLFITRMTMPKSSDVVSVDPKLLMEEADFQKQLPKDAPPSERLEKSRILTPIIGALGVAYLVMYFSEYGLDITINTVNLMSMIVGLLLHKTPTAYMHAISAVIRSTAGTLVQLLFYTGIQLTMEHSSLGELTTKLFINAANKDTFPVMTSLSSALINFAVPSGDGHWVTQGPFVVPAVQVLGTDLGKSVVAVACGEQWVNMTQPFWAPSALAIAELGVRDIMDYCITTLFFSSVIFVIGLTLF